MFKEQIKKGIASLFGKSADRFVIDDDIKVYSFDLFDTLIFRKVGSPHNVFLELDKRINEREGSNISFFSQRVKAERLARLRTNSEITLDDIYNEMTTVAHDRKKSYEDLEMDIEYETCEPRKDMIDLYDKIIDNGKTVIIISDMYMPKEILEKILEKCAISSPHKFYLSSEIGLTKTSGELYKYVLKDLNLCPEDIMHIGDSIKADWLMPKIIGIKSFLYSGV